MKIYILWIALFFNSLQSLSQVSDQEDDYRRVVTKRAEKIVTTLGITDSAHFFRVRDIIATQYVNLNAIQTIRENKKAITTHSDKLLNDKERKSVEEEATKQVDSLHKMYITSLSKELDDDQVEKVKDGMTYGVLPLTYKGYQEMLPELTIEQKKKILQLLTEAREKAMDAGSSEEKHKWFGKYKGRINNYLSSQGYDLKKASKEWQARIKAKSS